MKLKDALIAWTPARVASYPTAGQVKIGPLLTQGDPDWTRPYMMTGGAAYSSVRELRGIKAAAKIFFEFHALVVRDGLDPQTVHAAFLALDEYVLHISPDIPGAT